MSIRLYHVYTYEQKVMVNPLTLAAYALPWSFDGVYAYAWLCGLSAVAYRVKNSVLEVKVYASSHERCWEAVLDRGWRPVLDARELSRYYDRARSDPLLSCVGERLRGLTLRFLDVWQASIIAVCQQNASFIQGWKMVYNIYRMLGKTVELVEGDTRVLTLIPPTPSQVNEHVLREAGLGYRAKTLANIASRLKSMDYVLSPDNAYQAIRGVKGVGPYTRGLIELLALRNLSAIIIDRWIRGLVAEAYGVEIAEADKVWVNKWRPWQGLASLHLTIVFDAEPLTKSLERFRKGIKCPKLEHEKPTPLTLWHKMPKPWN